MHPRCMHNDTSKRVRIAASTQNEKSRNVKYSIDFSSPGIVSCMELYFSLIARLLGTPVDRFDYFILLMIVPYYYL